MVCAIIAALTVYRLPSNEKVNYFAKANPLIFNKEVRGYAYVQNKTIYVPMSFVKLVHEGVVFDEKSQSVIVTTETNVVQFPNKSLTYFVNEKKEKLQIPAMIQKEEPYVALTPLTKLFALKWEEKKSGAVFVYANGDELSLAKIEESGEIERRLRIKQTPKSPYVAEVNVGETVFVEKRGSAYAFVRRSDGAAGYIQTQYIKSTETKTVTVNTKKLLAPKITKPIFLSWEAVYTKNPNVKKLPTLAGVNVVSPTWFSITNDKGDIKNLASNEYANWAKKKNLQIWGLISNDFDRKRTHEVLKNFDTRASIIRKMLYYSQMYELSGINIDFENVNLEDGKLVTQFVREAAPRFHQARLVVSMDITFISSSPTWSKFYDREALSKLVDYLIVMAYDETSGNSKKAGSVATLPWVENHLKKLLNLVPNEKLILGIPLYTRLWEEKNGTVTSKALTMDKAKEWVATKKVTPVFDEQSGQLYVEYKDEKTNSLYKLWLEDESSLKKRVELSKKYKLSGIATWARSFGSETTWETLNNSVNPPAIKQ